MSKEITSKTKRLAQILAFLEQGSVKLPELATRLEVSVRTLQRDMLLFAKARVPIISPKQSVYEFVKGFSLSAVRLSCEQAALLVISADIACQIGEDFSATIPSISKRFEPTSFEHCDWDSSNDDFEETDQLARTLLKCTQEHWAMRAFLKDIKKDRNLYPYKVLSLWDKWYVACYTYGPEISLVALDNIGNYSLRDTFCPIPFGKWPIWHLAHQWVEDLDPSKKQPKQDSMQPLGAPTEPTTPQPLDFINSQKQKNDL